MATATVPSAPGTPDIVVTSSTDHPSPETTKTEFRNAAELRAKFDSLDKTAKTKGLSAKKSIDEFIPDLLEVRALLSQRGTKRLRGEAHLPNWTQYLKDFIQEVGLSISLRTLYRWLAPRTDPGGDKKEKRSAPKKARTFETGKELDFDALIFQHTELLTQIERLNDFSPLPVALMESVAECRKSLAGDTFSARPKAVAQIVQRPAVIRKSPLKDLTPMQKHKLLEQHVARITRNNSGKLIKTQTMAAN
jgi:hypothetical protein